MNAQNRSVHSAESSALGYLYQVRFALLESLRKLRKEQDFSVSIETLDDVVFDKSGDALELLQTKHHLSRAADLTDGSPDLWKTIRIWCEEYSSGNIPKGTIFYLITTAHAVEGHAAYYLKPGITRNPANAIQRLNSIAESSTNKQNVLAYQA